jgi:hypothetical protein
MCRSGSPVAQLVAWPGTPARKIYPAAGLHWLRGIVQAVPLLYADHVVGTGVDLFEAVCRNDLEGTVAKRAGERYAPEEATWVKTKK